VADGAWHGDNVWASLLGGAVIVLSVTPAEMITLPAPPRFRWITVHPEFRLDTRRARSVLPKRVPLLEATTQAGRFASLAIAWTAGDRRGIGRGLADLFAEPARSRLVPGFSQAKRAALHAGAYGMTFSGAGPSVVAVTPEGEEERVGRAIRRAFAREGLGSTQFICSVDALGAREVE
jgi:homoserine kinase